MPTESTWQLRTRRLEYSRRPLLMGIVNVTPDSFSDGGRFFSRAAAVEHAVELVAQGADILDVGGESTRPYAPPVPVAEELDRVIGVVSDLVRQANVPISIDTRKPEVAAAALEAGAEIINDVEGFRHERMRELAVEYRAGVCVMHMRGTPQTMQDSPCYGDVVGEIADYLSIQRDRLIGMGLESRRICLDPGIGFGKTTEHNLELLRNVDRLTALGNPVLIGHSRKGFLGKLIRSSDRDRTAATVGVSLGLARRGVAVLRVHDVEAHRDALTTFLATMPRDATQSHHH